MDWESKEIPCKGFRGLQYVGESRPLRQHQEKGPIRRALFVLDDRLAHAYITFRIHLARHGLRQFVASLKGSATILLLAGGHVLVGLLALSAFPSMYAASLAPLSFVGLLLAHALTMSLPVVLLRQRILPADVVRWLHRMPVAPRVALRADAAVVAALIWPLALLYAVSAAVLVYHGGTWLRPVAALLATAGSLLLTFIFSVAVLTLRVRRRPGAGQARYTAPGAYTARGGPLLPLLWHRLFWLPFWRADSAVGRQQSLLLAAAIGSAVPWMQAPAGMARGVLALATCTLMVLLTDRGDKAVREHTARLRPIMAAWPLAPRALFGWARALAAAPALLVMLALVAGGAHHGLWQHTAGQVFLALGCAAPLVLVATPVANEGFRVGLVAVEIMLLTAVGSEIWIA
jgi:hypothetical protein